MMNNSRYPFTQTQWQELEQQALIYNHMAQGLPIPSHLLLPIKSSCLLLPPPSSSSLSHLGLLQTHSPLKPQHKKSNIDIVFLFVAVGWSSCFHLGYGRKMAEDPEPGRCRRTDGKKWRCSKEACPESRYCERHMHRGKNRSRKPVEKISTTHHHHHPYSWELSLKRMEEEEEKPLVMKERDFFDGWAHNQTSSSSSSSACSISMALSDFLPQ